MCRIMLGRTKLQLAGALGGGAGQQAPLLRLQLLQLRRLCDSALSCVRHAEVLTQVATHDMDSLCRSPGCNQQAAVQLESLLAGTAP